MKIKLLGLFIIMMFLMMPNNICYANGAKPDESPNHDGLLYFSDDSNIQLVNEIISFDIKKVGGFHSEAVISVKYNLLNKGTNRSLICILFYLILIAMLSK